MAKPAKRKVEGGGATVGRTGQPTAKPTSAAASAAKAAKSAPSRYTPPQVTKDQLPSPTWVPVLMFTFWGMGLVVIFLNYVGIVLPGATHNGYLLVGLGLILAGIITATQYR